MYFLYFLSSLISFITITQTGPGSLDKLNINLLVEAKDILKDSQENIEANKSNVSQSSKTYKRAGADYDDMYSNNDGIGNGDTEVEDFNENNYHRNYGCYCPNTVGRTDRNGPGIIEATNPMHGTYPGQQGTIWAHQDPTWDGQEITWDGREVPLFQRREVPQFRRQKIPEFHPHDVSLFNKRHELPPYLARGAVPQIPEQEVPSFPGEAVPRLSGQTTRMYLVPLPGLDADYDDMRSNNDGSGTGDTEAGDLNENDNDGSGNNGDVNYGSGNEGSTNFESIYTNNIYGYRPDVGRDPNTYNYHSNYVCYCPNTVGRTYRNGLGVIEATNPTYGTYPGQQGTTWAHQDPIWFGQEITWEGQEVPPFQRQKVPPFHRQKVPPFQRLKVRQKVPPFQRLKVLPFQRQEIPQFQPWLPGQRVPRFLVPRPGLVIDGGWTEWGPCSKTCEGGLKRRRCTNPAPANGGAHCQRDSLKECNKDIQCTFVIYGGWTEWGPCSKTCEGGLKRRNCTNPVPANGGARCQGDSLTECNNDIQCTFDSSTTVNAQTMSTIPPQPPYCCGVKKENLGTSTRITKGKDTTINEYPWIAYIEVTYPDDRISTCGGSLIASQWILTAQHCIKRKKGFPPDTVRVTLGEHDMSIKNETGIEINVSVIEWFKYYDKFALKKDIALLKLSQPVDLMTYTPICLPEAGSTRNTYIGKKSWVYGWGITEVNGNAAHELQEATLDIISNSECTALYYRRDNFEKIEASQICALDMSRSGKDSCHGDSGGPLSYNYNSYGHHQQIGIVSYGKRCGTLGVPGVYTYVSYFRNWIDKAMADNGGAERLPPC